MRVSWRLLALSGAVLSLYDTVYAHSRSREPLNYLSLIEDAVIHTPSHRAHSHSIFDITLRLHRKRQRIKLRLEPNHDILPEGASVQYLDSDGNVRRSEPFDRTEHRVYKGSALVETDGGGWTDAGWARINLHRDGAEPLFEGAFSLAHDSHHVQLRRNYMRTKHEMDPALEGGGGDGDDDDDDDTGEYMVIFRDSDIADPPGHVEEDWTAGELRRRDRADGSLSCSAHRLAFNSDPEHPVYATMKRDAGSWGSMSLASMFGKRQIDGGTSGGNSAGVNLRGSIGNTAGCPNTRKVALIGVATDCSYVGTFGSAGEARANVITQINAASAIYETTFNITLGLQNLTMSDASCPGTPPASTPWNVDCSGNTTITDRLNMFSTWRGGRNDGNAYWTLLTNCHTGAEVGLAWLGQLCVTEVTSANGENTSGANVVAKTSTEWQVIAHESGHTFGAVHDCTAQTCADGNTVNSQQCCPVSGSACDAKAQFIMNPATGPTIARFSPCTVGNICSAMGRNSVRSSCLSDNRAVTTVTGAVCGNGIVEAGEDCDCGGTAACGENACCEPDTCKFKPAAVCDDSNEDCCRGCRFAATGTVCRASTGACDPQEVCSGTNSTCPTDATAPDGQGCGADGLQCASGQCTSRDLQCKALMGVYTTDNSTSACDSQTCTLSCKSPQFGLNTCYSMQQNFLDGTTCAGGGTCSNGQCKGVTPGGQVASWINDNKPLVIGICCGVGGLILISILSCLVGCCRRQTARRRAARKAAAVPPSPPPYVQQQQQQQQWSQPSPHPLPPLPQQPYRPYGGPSVRYA